MQIKNSFSFAFLLVGASSAMQWVMMAGAADPFSFSTIATSALVVGLIALVFGHLLEGWISAQKASLPANTQSLEMTDELERLQRKAEQDGLTSVLNRETFFEEVRKAQDEQSEGVLLMIDADNFKAINDTYGHAAGDRALRMIADLIAINIRGNDLVGRIGGEEFSVFLSGADRKTAAIAAERIRSSVAEFEFWPVDHQRHVLSISVGGAYLSTSDSLPCIFDLADARMYEAKKRGKNCCVIPFPAEANSNTDNSPRPQLVVQRAA